MSSSSKAKERISITILPFVNHLLDDLCKQSGQSKSTVIENALKQFLNEQLAKDAKALASLEYEDLPSEEDWLSIQSTID